MQNSKSVRLGIGPDAGLCAKIRCQVSSLNWPAVLPLCGPPQRGASPSRYPLQNSGLTGCGGFLAAVLFDVLYECV